MLFQACHSHTPHYPACLPKRRRNCHSLLYACAWIRFYFEEHGLYQFGKLLRISQFVIILCSSTLREQFRRRRRRAGSMANRQHGAAPACHYRLPITNNTVYRAAASLCIYLSNGRQTGACRVGGALNGACAPAALHHHGERQASKAFVARCRNCAGIM